MKYNKPYGAATENASYTNGNPSTGTKGSIPPAEAVEYPQREIVEVITHAGLSPTNTDLAQLRKAIQAMIASASTLITSGEGVQIDGASHTNLALRYLDDAIELLATDVLAVHQNVNGIYPAKHRKATLGGLAAFMALALPVSVLDVKAYTASGTYTPTVGTRVVLAFATGGGGGGCVGPGILYGLRNGGGGGGTAIAFFAPSGPEVVTIGAGGVAGFNADGGTGGTTSLGARAVATGGKGGRTNPSSGADQGSIGGAGTTGLVLLDGGPGAIADGGGGAIYAGGEGGVSFWGGAGMGGLSWYTGNFNGTAGTRGGGGGAGSGYGTGNLAAAGGDGFVLIIEFS